MLYFAHQVFTSGFSFFFFPLFLNGQKNPETLRQGQQSDSDIKL